TCLSGLVHERPGFRAQRRPAFGCRRTGRHDNDCWPNVIAFLGCAMTLRFRLLAGLAFAGLISGVAFSADPPAPAEPPPSKIDIHRLDNKELLAQANSLLRKASLAYLAQLRELVTLERSLDRARKRSEEVKVPPPPTTGAYNKPSPLETARNAAEQS